MLKDEINKAGRVQIKDHPLGPAQSFLDRHPAFQSLILFHNPIATTTATACDRLWLMLTDQVFRPSLSAIDLSRAVQVQERLTLWAVQDFKILPAHRADPCAQGLGSGFLGSEFTCRRGVRLPDFDQLQGGVNPLMNRGRMRGWIAGSRSISIRSIPVLKAIMTLPSGYPFEPAAAIARQSGFRYRRAVSRICSGLTTGPGRRTGGNNPTPGRSVPGSAGRRPFRCSTPGRAAGDRYSWPGCRSTLRR